jgi:chaperone required for assembly of F1-ATPase
MTTGWTFRRFWREVAIEPMSPGFAVTLDGREIRTPGKAPFVVPSLALAQLVAEEWRAQEGEVRPASMPATRMANSAIDKVSRHHATVVADLAGYAESDLICYRAEAPLALRMRQQAEWDPLIEWVGTRFGAHLRVAIGIMPVSQAPAAVRPLAAEVARQDDFQLAALHDIVSLSGSLVIALSVIEGFRSPAEAWELSRIDETWQVEQWGEDAEAAADAHDKRTSFFHAARFHALCR